jgi:transcription antitermination factor NusG
MESLRFRILCGTNLIDWLKMISKNLQEDFYAGKKNDKFKFSINDPVEILAGEYESLRCAVISIQEVEPEVEVRLEKGDDGSFIKVRQDSIRLIIE